MIKLLTRRWLSVSYNALHGNRRSIAVKERIIATTALLLGFVMLVNGTWQLAAPEGWFWAIPGVPDRGPFNQHFVRDLGIIYAMTGIGLIMGALRPQQRFGYWWAPCFWLVRPAGSAIPTASGPFPQSSDPFLPSSDPFLPSSVPFLPSSA